jgi:hypothetical protein
MIETLRAAMTALQSGRAADRAIAVERLLAEVSRGPTLAVNATLLLCGLGELDRAFDVARAYLLEEGPLMASVRWRAGQVSVNDQRRRKTNMIFVPVSAPMRADPRFADLVQRMGLADYWSRSSPTRSARSRSCRPISATGWPPSGGWTPCSPRRRSICRPATRGPSSTSLSVGPARAPWRGCRWRRAIR